MSTIASLTDPDAIAQLTGPPSATTFDRARIAREAPDLHLAVGANGVGCEARCSLWWTDTPPYDDQTVGLVGHYAAVTASAGQRVLERACRRLSDEGCTCAVGPMDGTTWYTYRFVTTRGDRPPFVLEPWHPAGYPDHFRNVGFRALAHYVSSVGADLDTGSEVTPPDRPPIDDVQVRSLDPDRFEAELRHLYPLITTCFAENFLYSPISEADFVDQYQQYRPYVQPDLVRLVEQGQGEERRVVGFAFLVPDVLQAERGNAIDTVVLKTMAVHPDLAGQGLGRWLTSRIHRRAQNRGFRRVVHALMHEDNISRNLGHGSPFRRYTLYLRELS